MANKVLKYNRLFSNNEYLFGTACLLIYLDLVKTMEPAMICYTPKYLEIIAILNDMFIYPRIYNLADPFLDPRKVKEQTIRGYLSLRSKVNASLVANRLYESYIGREDSSLAFIGNRKKVLKYLCKTAKNGEFKFLHKEKHLQTFNIEGKTKYQSDIKLQVAIKLKVGL